MGIEPKHIIVKILRLNHLTSGSLLSGLLNLRSIFGFFFLSYIFTYIYFYFYCLSVYSFYDWFIFFFFIDYTFYLFKSKSSYSFLTINLVSLKHVGFSLIHLLRSGLDGTKPIGYIIGLVSHLILTCLPINSSIIKIF